MEQTLQTLNMALMVFTLVFIIIVALQWFLKNNLFFKLLNIGTVAISFILCLMKLSIEYTLGKSLSETIMVLVIITCYMLIWVFLNIYTTSKSRNI